MKVQTPAEILAAEITSYGIAAVPSVYGGLVAVSGHGTMSVAEAASFLMELERKRKPVDVHGAALEETRRRALLGDDTEPAA